MKLLYEDRDLIVCEKPPEAPSEPDGRGRDILTLAETLTGARCRLVHRLDRGTGGAMLLAKTEAAASRLSAAVRDGNLEKEYLAVLRGDPEAPQAVLHDLLYHDPRRNKSFVVKRERRGVRAASLEYRLLATIEGLSLVRVRLHTGRTHQIRVQFASRGLPLYGDRRYGGGAGDMALWSAALSFPHPRDNRIMNFDSRPPESYPWSLFTEHL